MGDRDLLRRLLRRPVLAAALAGLGVVAAGCDLAYPEVAVANDVGPDVVLRNPSWNGCVWNVVLNYGETTVPRRCLPGAGRVHFGRLDLGAWADGRADGGDVPPEPAWFNYETATVRSAGAGDFRVFRVAADDLEQDFSIPGPYGH